MNKDGLGIYCIYNVTHLCSEETREIYLKNQYISKTSDN
jgi:hypothetical protein